MVHKDLIKAVQESLRKHPAPGSSSFSAEYASSDFKFHSMARLWAGMGYIYRVDIDVKGGNTSPDHHNNGYSRVVKHVRLPSTIDSRGDQRKADSYFVEANFYEHLVPSLRDEYSINLPESYHVERAEKSIIIVMSYINANGSAYLNPDRTRLVLSWLARFHGATWGRAEQLVQQHGLQKLGTYWHLETRPDEHASMSNKGWQGRLKKAALAIHERLQRDPCQCLVHGDVKDANLLFPRHKDNEEVVLCDFQYCGQGVPTQDLAYFFCSSVEDLQNEDDYLSFYLAELTKSLPAGATPPTLDMLRDSLEWAYCDFARFMAGWGTWGNDLSDRVQRKLNLLDDGRNLGSEEGYCAAMSERFG